MTPPVDPFADMAAYQAAQAKSTPSAPPVIDRQGPVGMTSTPAPQSIGTDVHPLSDRNQDRQTELLERIAAASESAAKHPGPKLEIVSL